MPEKYGWQWWLQVINASNHSNQQLKGIGVIEGSIFIRTTSCFRLGDCELLAWVFLQLHLQLHLDLQSFLYRSVNFWLESTPVLELHSSMHSSVNFWLESSFSFTSPGPAELPIQVRELLPWVFTIAGSAYCIAPSTGLWTSSMSLPTRKKVWRVTSSRKKV